MPGILKYIYKIKSAKKQTVSIANNVCILKMLMVAENVHMYVCLFKNLEMIFKNNANEQIFLRCNLVKK